MVLQVKYVQVEYTKKQKKNEKEVIKDDKSYKEDFEK